MPVIRNFGPLQNIKLTDKSVMREIGLMARDRIRRRTEAGTDSEGKPFKPYSKSYAAKKEKELGTSTPNLTVSGGMLNAIQITRVTDDEVEISIPFFDKNDG